MSEKLKREIILVTVISCIIILIIAVFINYKNSTELKDILAESIKSQLISTSIAAREKIDTDKFYSYNNIENVENDRENYDDTLTQLRILAKNAGAKYIYALKYIDGEYMFIFDTDLEDEEIFVPYKLSQVHINAFIGQDSADVMNVNDEYGSFNTGAVPIWKDGKVIGIVSTDIEDEYFIKSIKTGNFNSLLLIIILIFTLGIIILLVVLLLNHILKMQKKLEHIANYDNVTGIANRHHLLNYLTVITSRKFKPDFALLFIDLDNFKSVNDNAGHDAGDELLKHIAEYLEYQCKSMGAAKAFRPSAGLLNVAARIGGDEFIVLLDDVKTFEEAEEYTQKILYEFSEKITNKYVEKYSVGLSIGIALYPYHTENFHVLIKYADIAMYNAKRSGKNGYCVYNDEMRIKENV